MQGQTTTPVELTDYEIDLITSFFNKEDEDHDDRQWSDDEIREMSHLYNDFEHGFNSQERAVFSGVLYKMRHMHREHETSTIDLYKKAHLLGKLKDARK